MLFTKRKLIYTITYLLFSYLINPALSLAAPQMLFSIESIFPNRFTTNKIHGGFLNCQGLFLYTNKETFNEDLLLKLKALARFRYEIDQKKFMAKESLLIMSLENNFTKKLGELLSEINEKDFKIREIDLKKFLTKEVRNLHEEEPFFVDKNLDTENEQKKILDEKQLFSTETFYDHSIFTQKFGEIKTSGISTISNDGKYLILESQVNSKLNQSSSDVNIFIRVTDIITKQILGTISYKNSSASFLPSVLEQEIHISNDRKKIVFFGFQYIDIYSLETEKLIKRFNIDEFLDQFFISPDGRYVFTNSYDSSALKIIDLSNDKILDEVIDYKATWGPLLFTKDGKYIIRARA